MHSKRKCTQNIATGRWIEVRHFAEQSVHCKIQASALPQPAVGLADSVDIIDTISQKVSATRGGGFYTLNIANLNNEGEKLEGVASQAEQGHQGPWDSVCPDEDSSDDGGLEFEDIGFDFPQGKQMHILCCKEIYLY